MNSAIDFSSLGLITDWATRKRPDTEQRFSFIQTLGSTSIRRVLRISQLISQQYYRFPAIWNITWMGGDLMEIPVSLRRR